MKFKFTQEQTNLSIPYELHLNKNNVIAEDTHEFDIVYDENVIGNVYFNQSNISFPFHSYILEHQEAKKYIQNNNEKVLCHLDHTYDYTKLYSINHDNYLNRMHFSVEDIECYNVVRAYLFLSTKLYNDMSNMYISINNSVEKPCKCISVVIKIFNNTHYTSLIYCDILDETVEKYLKLLEGSQSKYTDNYNSLQYMHPINIVSIMDAYVVLKRDNIIIKRFDNTLKYKHIVPILNLYLKELFGSNDLIKDKQDITIIQNFNQHNTTETTKVNTFGENLVNYAVISSLLDSQDFSTNNE